MALVLWIADATGFVRRVALPAMVTLSLGGCASVSVAPSAGLALRTTPPGAEVKTSTGESCSTPCTLQLSPDADLTVIVSKRGFQTERFEVGDRCASTVDIALRPISSITAYELPDRDLPLVADCGRRSPSRQTGPALGPIH